ncbi:MAG: thiamine phosphate synthase [Parvibaculaceae bacterium]
MSVKLDPFYPIVDSAGWVARLVPHGVKLVQLRIKDRPADAVVEDIIQARDICRCHGCQLIVNDHWREAIDAGCDFVHLGQGDLDDADMSAIRKAGVRLGISTHDHAELDRALALEPDYVALGPIYPTLLKEMPWTPQGLDRIREWKQLVGSIPLVAIGGLTVKRLPRVFAAGADSAAVVTDILRHADPEARTRQWLTATQAPA